MSLRSIALLGLLVACGSDGDDKTPTDTSEDPNAGCSDHPNIPEGYECFWLDDGCMSGTAPANQIYYLFEGEIDAVGNFSGTETFYWFYPLEGREDDCIDKLSVTGRVSSEDPSDLACSGCELVYNLERTELEKNCFTTYNLFFPDQEGTVFKQKLLVDYLTPNGDPQEDNNALLMHRTKDRRGNWSTEEYARGTVDPTGTEFGPPMKISWIGEVCKGR